MKIGLLWHSNSSANLGVGALTTANIAQISQICEALEYDVDFDIIGWEYPGAPYVVGANITVTRLRLKDFFPFFGKLHRASLRCDVVIDIGAGDSFSDIYGFQRLLTQVASKFIVWAARSLLVLAPQTIGPFERRSSRLLSRWAMNRAVVVFTRDEHSTKFALEIGVKTPIIESTDVAMRLPYEVPPHREPGGPTRIGINVSGLLMDGGSSGSDLFGLSLDYQTFVRQLITATLEREGYELHLVPHVATGTGSVEDDGHVCRLLAEEFPDSVLAPRFGSPSEAKSYIAGLDGFSGARMHACIAAFSAGVPVLPLAYSRKFEGLFGALGYTRLVDCRSDDLDTAMLKYNNFLDSLEAARHEVEAATLLVDERLRRYHDELERILRRAAESKSVRT